jgi:hypothetical protein
MVKRIGSFLVVLLLIAQVASATNVTVGGTAPPGSAPLDNPVVTGGNDGTNVRTFSTDTSGRTVVTGQGAEAAAVAGNPVRAAGTDGSNTRTIGVNPSAQVLVNPEGQDATYTATALGFTPAATATDFISLTGSASKNVRILRVVVSGVATTGTIADLVIVKRSTADTSGTPTTLTAVPHDANDAAATGTAVSYAANPTTGSLIGNIGARKIGLVTAASNIIPQTIEYRPGNNLDQTWVLRGVAQVIALNWNGAAVPTGTSLDVEITWKETSY